MLSEPITRKCRRGKRRTGKMYYTYMLLCRDNTIYTGITTDPERRFHEHCNGGKAAKYTRSHQAKQMIALWQTESRSLASKLEYFIKSLTKKQKERLADSGNLSVYAEQLPTECYTLIWCRSCLAEKNGSQGTISL